MQIPKPSALAFLTVLPLAACGSSEPTEEEMRAALEGKLSDGQTRVLSLTKEACTKQSSDRYRCSYVLEVELHLQNPENPFRPIVKIDTRTMDDVFQRDDGGWDMEPRSSAG